MVALGRAAGGDGESVKTRGNPAARATASPAPRADGLQVLEPRICCIYGEESRPHIVPSNEQLDALYNEGGQGARHYPLALRDGRYFSEAVGEANAEATEYEDLINRSLDLFLPQSPFRALSIEALYECGRALQKLDRDFASSKIGRPLDSLHRCMGTDAGHPYAKITVCRTTFPVEVSGKSIPFFYEKFLVAYSYLDEQGRRRSTVTPAHSHPINFETGYFTHFGPRSGVIEQEFDLLGPDGCPVIGPDNRVSAEFSTKLDWNSNQVLRARPASQTLLTPSENPVVLAPFASEAALTEDREKVIRFDGLFRAHRVEVLDDPDVETRYFALDNYFGPACRVLVFDDAGNVRKWQHHEWTGR
jgi:hypothetical protein